MSEVINSIFGRSKDDTATSDEDVATSITAHSDNAHSDTNQSDTIQSGTEDAVAEPAEAESTDGDHAEDDESPEGEPAIESAADEDGGITDEDETSENDVDQLEPVTADTRPAAGTRGSTTVGDAVVVKIVDMVARKAEGVHGVGDQGISVEIDGDIATVNLPLVVEFGHAVKALAEQIRIDVVEAIEQFLGLDVAVVDVHVADIHLPDAA
jgi:uncharacterized alkaline shock family protein YloU